MAVYALGDVQGCYTALMALLERLAFDPARDRLLFTGDLVNRGPQSLPVLEFVMGLGARAVTVLGNHDLHLLAVGYGGEPARRGDTFHDVLGSPRRETLLAWLRRRPLLYQDTAVGVTVVHAGLPPQWDVAAAAACAAEVEAVLRGGELEAFFTHMYGDEPRRWDAALSGWERLRFITNCLTRLRFCDAFGAVALREKGPPGSQPGGYMPWFEVPGRCSAGSSIVCGHWSTLGAGNFGGVYALDSGCVWGGRLTALRLDGPRREFVSVPCAGGDG